jgi:dTMP kinase
VFLSFDGLDGTGKTTQIERLVTALRAQGRSVTTCRDPGSTELGNAVRQIVLHGKAGAVSSRAEMLLYMAARAQLVAEVIRPALDRGEIVISDRFLLANVVYQGHAGGLPVDDLWDVGRLATGGLLPDVTIVLDLDPQAALRRLNRPLDTLEQRSIEYRQAVRAGFLAEAKRQPDRIQVLSAEGTIEEVGQRIGQVVSSWLENQS